MRLVLLIVLILLVLGSVPNISVQRWLGLLPDGGRAIRARCCMR